MTDSEVIRLAERAREFFMQQCGFSPSSWSKAGAMNRNAWLATIGFIQAEMKRVDAPIDLIHKHLAEIWGYEFVRTVAGKLPFALQPYLLTTAVVVDLTYEGHRGRYCYANRKDALEAFTTWDGEGDPPGPWIKYKGVDGERLGPGALDEVTT